MSREVTVVPALTRAGTGDCTALCYHARTTALLLSTVSRHCHCHRDNPCVQLEYGGCGVRLQPAVSLLLLNKYIILLCKHYRFVLLASKVYNFIIVLKCNISLLLYIGFFFLLNKYNITLLFKQFKIKYGVFFSTSNDLTQIVYVECRLCVRNGLVYLVSSWCYLYRRIKQLPLCQI